MLLTVDVGNTNIVFGIFENNQCNETFRLTTKQNRTADELGLALLQFFAAKQIAVGDIKAIIAASVVPSCMLMLLAGLEKYLGKVPLVVDRDIFPALRYEGEGRLGVDRAVCCDAAVAKYGAPLIVLDLGTATTIDAVSADAWYLGGCIMAGMKVSADALTGMTAQLPEIELTRPKTFLGYNTIEQIQIGSVSAYIGALQYLLTETAREMNSEQPVKIIATGGLAPLVAKHLSMIDVVDDTLQLDGLRIIYEAQG